MACAYILGYLEGTLHFLMNEATGLNGLATF